MPLSRTRYVNLLRAQKGYHEGRDADGNWNNHQRFSPETSGLEWSQNQAWCHTFVSWGADELGGREVIPITASCETGVNWFKNRDRWTDYPVLGAPFYMGTRGQDHVGVVYAYDADWIYTIEGNTNSGGSYQGDGVYERKRPRRGAGSPYGYGVPAFTEGTISADPNLGGVKAASVPQNQEEDDDMPTPQEIAKAVWEYKIPTDKDSVPAGAALGWSDARHNVVYGRIVALQSAVAALVREVSPAELERIIKEAVAEAARES
jgi:hypothetical protein